MKTALVSLAAVVCLAAGAQQSDVDEVRQGAEVSAPNRIPAAQISRGTPAKLNPPGNFARGLRVVDANGRAIGIVLDRDTFVADLDGKSTMISRQLIGVSSGGLRWIPALFRSEFVYFAEPNCGGVPYLKSTGNLVEFGYLGNGFDARGVLVREATPSSSEWIYVADLRPSGSPVTLVSRHHVEGSRCFAIEPFQGGVAPVTAAHPLSDFGSPPFRVTP